MLNKTYLCSEKQCTIKNKSQSSNDTFPTAMHIATYKLLAEKTIPALEDLKSSINLKVKEFKSIVKIGRTHLMDATPITLGQEFTAFSCQLDHGVKALKNTSSFRKPVTHFSLI